MTTQPPLTIDLVQRRARAFIDRDASVPVETLLEQQPFVAISQASGDGRGCTADRHPASTRGLVRSSFASSSKEPVSVEPVGPWSVIVDRVPGFKRP